MNDNVFVEPVQEYLTQPVYLVERNADYSALDVAARFTVLDSYNGGLHGNLCGYIYFDPATKKAFYGGEYDFAALNLYRAISSALLLYRLACLFKAQVHTWGHEGYKSVWSLVLNHNPTDTVIMFGEHKGAAMFWSRFHSDKDAPPEYLKDVLELLTILVSDTCPHPYDGLVAGSVA